MLSNLHKAAKKQIRYILQLTLTAREAISWHLMQALKEDPSKMRRISFNEITKTAVKEFHQTAAGSGYEPGRCTAGTKNA